MVCSLNKRRTVNQTPMLKGVFIRKPEDTKKKGSLINVRHRIKWNKSTSNISLKICFKRDFTLLTWTKLAKRMDDYHGNFLVSHYLVPTLMAWSSVFMLPMLLGLQSFPNIKVLGIFRLRRSWASRHLTPYEEWNSFPWLFQEGLHINRPIVNYG